MPWLRQRPAAVIQRRIVSIFEVMAGDDPPARGSRATVVTLEGEGSGGRGSNPPARAG
jgi:hypothetical protein